MRGRLVSDGRRGLVKNRKWTAAFVDLNQEHLPPTDEN
jgi:hypothetical protein